MPRAQDVLFGVLGLAVLVLAAFHLQVAILGLLGAFGCGALYVFVGMMPSRDESLGHRLFNSVFLSLVLSSLVLILPGTFGLHGPHPNMQRLAVDVAGLLPVIAIGFEILRTPRVSQGILRWLGRCLGPRQR